MPELFSLERARAHRRKPTPAMFTGCCCLTDKEVRMRNVRSMGRDKDQIKSILNMYCKTFKML